MRKSFATSIEQDIQDQFKATCKEYGQQMNTILEALMQDFISGNYTLIVTKSGVSVQREGDS